MKSGCGNWAQLLNQTLTKLATKAIVCDVDDTLINSQGNGMDKTVSFLNSHRDSYRIIIVTARNTSRKSKTEEQLKEIGVKYDEIHLNPGSSAPGAARSYKKDVMSRLIKKYDVVLAIDNSQQARSAYQSLGVKSVHPNSLSSQTLSKSLWGGLFNLME
jgi:ribonucleotide monophosphatase NagD (HAD superfamily)